MAIVRTLYKGLRNVQPGTPRALCRSKSYFANDRLVVSEEVSEALYSNKAVVSLESTIVTHGMPYPQNIETALAVEQTVKDHGAVPATIAILNGKMCVGVSVSQLEYLASGKAQAVKTSRRDLPYVLSQELNGGTTVSGTMVASHMAGISLFVTGGIGGVHRGAETSMDVSADLTELGRTPVTVVSAGVKSILDIPKTLEYLETEGVCVASFGSSREFPAFFSSTSGYKSPYNVTNASQAAQLVYENEKLHLQSGMLIAVAVPEEASIDPQLMEAAIQTAISQANSEGVSGKDVTPYVLGHLNQVMQGRSLQTNIALVKNNARVGSEIACELARLRQNQDSSKPATAGTSPPHKPPKKSNEDKKRIVVIGGVNVDFNCGFKVAEPQSNGGTYPGQVKQAFGGVGRNIADCLSRLISPPLLLSAVGTDIYAETLFHQSQHMDMSAVRSVPDLPTATYCAILKSTGGLIYGIGDFDIHREIDSEYVLQNEEELANASLVCMDGNIPTETMATISSICSNYHVPVFFEPTDLRLAGKVFDSNAWTSLSVTSPNLNELRVMHSYYDRTSSSSSSSSRRSVDNSSISSSIEAGESETVDEACSLASCLVRHIPTILVTLGKHGVLFCSQHKPHQVIATRYNATTRSSRDVFMKHYQAPPLPRDQTIASVSGAGDCLAAAVMVGMMAGRSADHCVTMGQRAAVQSLLSYRAVPLTISL